MRLIIVANREPLRQEPEGWVPAVGGLTTALLPILEEQGGIWVSWGEKEPQVQVLQFPPDNPRFEVHRLALSRRAVTGYYYGMANRTLWPLAHYFVERTDLRREFFPIYRRANRKFAEKVLQVWREGDRVWVHDYHLMLVPEMLREARPQGRIGFFWHIPWPSVEVWRVLPWARILVRGLLGADLIGFHVREYVENFLDACSTLLGAEVGEDYVRWNGRTVRVEAHPIGIDTDSFTALAQDRRVRRHAQRLRKRAGTEYIAIGVDRMDYTKGILERLLAFERFLELYPRYRGRITLLQIAVPSRTRVDAYRDLKRQVDEVVGRITGAFTRHGWVPVHYFYRPFPPQDLAAYYLAGDAALVTPLRDGMNLVAQEYVATTEAGVLVLSELAGASQVLPEALMVNPYDTDGVAEALRNALEMSQTRRQAALQALKRRVADLDVKVWARCFLASLERAGV